MTLKTVTILLYLLIAQLAVYRRAITRFRADDKVVYQWVRREMRLSSDNSCALHRLKHLSWRSRWIILCTLEQRMVSRKISRADRCLFGLSSWLSTRSSTATRQTQCIQLRGCRTFVPVLRILFSWLWMVSSFQP